LIKLFCFLLIIFSLSLNTNASNDEHLYLQVQKEYEAGIIDEALWSKAMTLSSGNQEKAKYSYISLKVEKILSKKNLKQIENLDEKKIPINQEIKSLDDEIVEKDIISLSKMDDLLLKEENFKKFEYVNDTKCPNYKRKKDAYNIFRGDQKYLLDTLFGENQGDRMGCSLKKDKDLICKYPKDTIKNDQRCFGLNLFSSYIERKNDAGSISPLVAVVPFGLYLDSRPIFSTNWMNAIRSSSYFVKSKVEKLKIDGKKKKSMIVERERLTCTRGLLNIKSDWFYIIEKLMLENGWTVKSKNYDDRRIYLKPEVSQWQITNTNTSIQRGSLDGYPQIDMNKFINDSKEKFYNPYNSSDSDNKQPFIMFSKDNLYAEFSWLDENFRKFITFGMKDRNVPDATVFIYEKESRKKSSRNYLISKPDCSVGLPIINNTIHFPWFGNYEEYING